MKTKLINISLIVLLMIFVNSCTKEDEITNSILTTNHQTARLNTELTDAQMETVITDFLVKIEEPEGFEDMEVEDAFDLVEAALNYKYVNYDYSKCANTTAFEGEIQITPDGQDKLSMSAISEAYESILDDWSTKFHSVDQEVKIPIVFDITNTSGNVVTYRMVVGYGSLELSEWGEDFEITSGTIFWEDAQLYMTNRMYNHLNSNLYSNVPSGARMYVVNVGYKADFGYKGPLNPTDPIPNDGFIDNYFWYTEKGQPGYHFLLFQYEFDYHLGAYFTFVQEFLNTLPNANTCTFSGMGANYEGSYFPYPPNSRWPDKAGLIPAIGYGSRYFTIENLSQL